MRDRPRPTPPLTPEALAERLLTEGLLSVTDALAAEGVSASSKTATRWSLHGAHGVRLETIRVGGRRLTSRAAVRRFVAAQQHDAPPATRG